ncbi:NAD-binding protein [Haloferacaceae archaeon DSL9]
MERTREWVTLRAAILLTFAVAILSIVTGLANIGNFGVDGPLAAYVPPAVQRTVSFTGTITGFVMLCGAYALKHGYRIGWRTTVLLVPLTALQGILQSSPYSIPLIVLSVLSIPALIYNRKRFDRSFNPSSTQLAAVIAIISAQAYGTLGTYALQDHFDGIETIVDAFYFTLVTGSTVGYGDIAAITPEGRMFAVSVLLINVAAFAVALGVILTPAIEAQFSKALGRMTDDEFELLDDHFLVLGYGELTEPILEELSTRAEYVVVTPDETRSRTLAERDIHVLTADPSDESTLNRVSIESARAVLVATNNDAEDALAILTARQLNPEVRIVAAASQRENIPKLRRAGANTVISPAVIGGHLLVESAVDSETDPESLSEELLGESPD